MKKRARDHASGMFAAAEEVVKKRPGRPRGSKTKVNVETVEVAVEAPKRNVGRPKGPLLGCIVRCSMKRGRQR